MRVKVTDFQEVTEQDLSGIAPSRIFRDPEFYSLRIHGATRKLSKNTGIPEYLFSIQQIQSILT